MALDPREGCGVHPGQTAKLLITHALIRPDTGQRFHGKVDDFFGGAAGHPIT